jgi:hypothetical protein
MKYKLTVKPIILASALLIAVQVSGYTTTAKSAFVKEGNRINAKAQDNWNERDEIHQSYKLAPGARVEVSMIYGPVDIETINGSVAEVHIIRTARSRKDFETRRINIENAPTSLIISGERDMSQEEARVRHRVLLRLPRQVSLVVEKINARVNIGEIDGAMRLERINGAVNVAQAAGFVEASNINGSLAMTIARLNERGVRAKDINGSVELRFSSNLNANLNVVEYNGSVNSELPDTTVLEKKPNEFFAARIGAGGIPISITGVNGGVRLMTID